MDIPQIVVAALAVAVLTVAAGAGRARRAMRELYAPAPTDAAEVPVTLPRASSAPLTAVVLLDPAGTEVSDFLLPYELLAASGAFRTFAAGPAAGPATLSGGLDVLPHATFDTFAEHVGRPADLVVVPHLPDPDPRTVEWIRSRSDAGATILTICTGAGVAAAAGILDGRPATAHWGDLGRFERRYPEVRWTRGVRYVDDGDIVASAGITSGIDATLHVIRRLAGDGPMRAAAERIGYTDLSYLDDPAAPQFRVEPADLALPLQAAFGRRRPLAVLLRDGVDEAALAAAMDTHGATFTARTRTVSDHAAPVRSRHGLTVLSRGATSGLHGERVLVPAAPGSEDRAAAVVDGVALPAGGPPYLAFQSAIDDLATHHGSAIARFAAKRLEHRPLRTARRGRSPQPRT